MTHTDQTERPLVTFALFAYNQEQYIREAVEGAFSQTYEPLEIILSDDCSSDRTFEIMQEMVAAYKGPHEVKLRRSEINLGTALHVSAVAKQANGELFVVAAGDDISLPARCQELARVWLASERTASCVHSGYISFDESTRFEKSIPPRTTSLDTNQSRDFTLLDALPFASPTCAYSSELFRAFPPLIGGSIIEDGPMALRSLLFGPVISVPQVLVRVREAAETSGTGYCIDQPERWNRFIHSRIVSYRTTSRDVMHIQLETEMVDKLQLIYKKKLQRLPRFLIIRTKHPNTVNRFFFALKYILLYPSSARFPNKLSDALAVAGLPQEKIRFLYKKLLS